MKQANRCLRRRDGIANRLCAPIGNSEHGRFEFPKADELGEELIEHHSYEQLQRLVRCANSTPAALQRAIREADEIARCSCLRSEAFP